MRWVARVVAGLALSWSVARAEPARPPVPKTPDAVRAHDRETAAAALEHANALDQARDAYLALANDLPHTPSAAAALFAAARIDERLARWDEAVASYERLAATYPRDVQAVDAVYNVGVLRCALGQNEAARVALVRYARDGAARGDAAQVAFTIAELAPTAAAFEAIVKQYPGMRRAGDALVLAARAALAAGDTASARKDLAAALARWKGLTEQARRADASGPEARYLQGELAAAAADHIAITGVEPKAMHTALTGRVSAIQGAKEILLDVFTLDEPTWAIAAAYRIGVLYETFADGLHAAPPPSGLTPDEADAYVFQIDSMSSSVSELAVQAFRIAYQKGRELALFSEPFFAARAALIRLGELPVEREARADVRFEDTPEIQPVDQAAPAAAP
jgi:tetratricopeptide (TPR) repeat protein